MFSPLTTFGRIVRDYAAVYSDYAAAEYERRGGGSALKGGVPVAVRSGLLIFFMSPESRNFGATAPVFPCTGRLRGWESAVP